MEEPGILMDDDTQSKSVSSTAKKNLATMLTVGIIIGFLVMLFALTIILIDLIPFDDKLNWLFNTATIGNWILLVGTGMIEFFFALTISVYIWKKGRNYLLKRI